MKPRKGLSVYVLLVGVLGLLVVAGIFGFQIIDEATKSQISVNQRDLVKPIDGIIEQRAITNLQSRKIISKDEINFIPTPVQLPQDPIVAPTATASVTVATTSTQIKNDAQ